MSQSFTDVHNDPVKLGEVLVHSRFLLGTAGYPSPQVLESAISASETEVVTMGNKRQAAAAPPTRR